MYDKVVKYYYRGQIHEIRQVTEWRNSCIYKTNHVGFVVYASDMPAVKKSRDIIDCAPSTSLIKE